MLLIPAMAAVTEHLGFGVTGMVGFEPPYPFARRMSTLDHLTNGRVAWNVVTGYLDSAARGMGLVDAADARPALRGRGRVHGGRLPAVGGKLGGRRGGGRRARARLRRPRQGAPRALRRRALPRRRDPPVRAVAAAHARSVPGRRFRARPRVRRAPRRVRVHPADVEVGRGGARGRPARARRRAGPRGRRPAHLQHGHRDHRPRRGRGAREARRLPPLRQCRERARRAVRRQRHRPREVRARRAAALREDRGGPVDRAHVPSGRHGEVADDARAGGARGDRQRQPARRRITRAGSRRARGLGRGDRNRRLQPRLRGDARDVHGLRRARRAGAPAPRAR